MTKGAGEAYLLSPTSFSNIVSSQSTVKFSERIEREVVPCEYLIKCYIDAHRATSASYLQLNNVYVHDMHSRSPEHA